MDRKGAVVMDYAPTGRLIADSGLRPNEDGFGFANYGDDTDVTNLTPAAVEQLFGPEVCASGSGAACQLTPPAQAWMDEQNSSMAAGHCFGMAAAAARFFDETLSTDAFGAPSTVGLELESNAPLQREIAQLNAVQELPSIRRNAVGGSPNSILDRLAPMLADGVAPPVLGLFHPKGGGHAVTPYAIEERGDDAASVLVYDNNFPGITRAIEFDRKANTWQFVAQANPDAEDEVYSGDAGAGNLALFPTDQPEGRLPCPFCLSAREATGDERPRTEVALEGDPRNHSNLVITDAKDRRLGYVDGAFVSEIPGAEVVHRLAADDDAARAEPVYLLPYGGDFSVTIDGASLTDSAVEQLTIVGPGLRVEVSGIEMDPDETVVASVAGDGGRVQVRTDPAHDESPVLRLGIQADPASWDFMLHPRKMVGGATLEFRIDRRRKQIDIDTRGARGDLSESEYDSEIGEYDVEIGRYDVQMDKHGPDGTATFKHTGLRIPPEATARLDYGTFDEDQRILELRVVSEGHAVVRRIQG